jgi:hypothetical protein
VKIIGKAIIPLFLVAVFLNSCNNFASPTSINATDVAGTAMVIVKTSIVETQGAIPTITFTPQLPTLIPPTPLPPTETPTPIKTFPPISGTPTTIELEDGLVWTECIVPPFTSTNSDIAATCLNMNWAGWDDYNMMLNGQRLHGERVKGICGDNLRLVIGKDIYETSYTVPTENSCYMYDYELLKNGVVIATVKGVISNVVDANYKLWNVDGKSVWEINSDPPAESLSAIIVDGVNLNEKYQLGGSFDAYYFKDKIIFIALKNGKYHIVYNGKFIGPEFDQIFIYGGPPSVLYGHEQYWFLGTREGTYYVVAIH